MDFLEQFRNGLVVRCYDGYQKAEILQYLLDNGFDLSSTMLGCIRSPEPGTRYLWIANYKNHPERVSAWCSGGPSWAREEIGFGEFKRMTKQHDINCSAAEIAALLQ